MNDRMTESTNRPPITNVYSGDMNDRGIHARSVKACQDEWNREFNLGSFDDLLYDQLIHAEHEGRSHVVVVDIGSGEKANLFQSFLDTPGYGQKTREFLSAHPSMHILMIGITHATSRDLQGTQRVLTSSPTDATHNIHAINISYSLSVNQRLKPLIKSTLQTEQLPDARVDLILATVSLTYMGKNTFEHVVQDATALLREHGGTFVAAKYAFYDIPGFKRDSMLAYFPRIGWGNKFIFDSDSRSWAGWASDAAMRYGRTEYDHDSHIADVHRQIEVEDELIRRQLLSQEEVNDARNRFKTKRKQDEQQALTDRIFQTMDLAIKRQAKRKYEQLKNQKQQILEEIKIMLQNQADVQIGDLTFVIKKTS